MYALACEDENGVWFIVARQNREAPDFVWQLKFYGLRPPHSLAQRGESGHRKPPEICGIGFLGKKLLDNPHYRSVINLRDEQGRLVDEQLTIIIVELAKFNKLIRDISTDLDKLLYTMKTVDGQDEKTPDFWQEEWLSGAIQQLDTRRMSPDERASYNIAYIRHMEAVNYEKYERERNMAEGKAEGRETEKQEVILNGQAMGLSADQLARLVGETVAYVETVLAR